MILALALAQGWPMAGQNPQRTHRSPHEGPKTATCRWTYEARGGLAINLQAVVDERGVYFGTWGLLRRDPTRTPDRWDKADGRYYGLALADGRELYEPLRPAPTPVGYLREGRAKTPTDAFFCGKDNDYLVSWYNGTIEGTACIDPTDGTHYVGRGDGKLYAIDAKRGEVKWSFATFNPEDRDDPDGGGEIVGGPLIHDGVIYFGTVGMPWPGKDDQPARETHALYAVGRDGNLLWRYPEREARLANQLYAPPALSPDGKTIYVATRGGDFTIPGELMAFDLKGALRWSTPLRLESRPLKPAVQLHVLAVGADGTIYGGGWGIHFGGSSPVAVAVAADGRVRWTAELQGWPSKRGKMCLGLAIGESAVYATTSHLRSENGEGGALVELDPATGELRRTFEPETAVGGMTAPVVDAAGRIYVGVRGKHPAFRREAVAGRMLCLSPALEPLWEFEVDGQIDWAAPAIGADGGLYFGTTAPCGDPLIHAKFFRDGETPADTTPTFYGLRD